MQLRRLGKTGLQVAVIGFGGIPIQRVSSDQAVKVVEAAVAGGINFIDTARAYTDSESKLGGIIGSHRNKLIIATKSMARSRKDMARDIDTSLREMKTDYIDIYQLHNVKDEGSLEKVLAPGGALEALQDARSSGKIRFIGVTGHIAQILVKVIGTGQFDTVQVPFNPVEIAALDELLPLARDLDMGTIAMKPFAGGAFKNRTACLKFIIENGFTTAIPGMDEVSQVAENIAAGQIDSELSGEEKSLLDEETELLGRKFCRRCEYCQPCPRGIDIPTIFLLQGYSTRYGLQEWAVERYRPMPAKISDCADCGQCEEKCPYSLPIREMLKEAGTYLEK
ncbi:aldo/keto reductase [Phosphitispora fastidiosa]|uniref:aldo/keto reductase n=1 Tax=Phosphitispora fastidiosa TaxID=2837202 RepID=UPI001E59A242|nr:aldo/keto reductase [Phosphitispora fastidiosa]MBU7008116.1 putative aldo/keto reductase-like oxidoreductase [Phosphitispora fastidiosa]